LSSFSSLQHHVLILSSFSSLRHQVLRLFFMTLSRSLEVSQINYSLMKK
jgi:hypothetical protein